MRTTFFLLLCTFTSAHQQQISFNLTQIDLFALYNAPGNLPQQNIFGTPNKPDLSNPYVILFYLMYGILPVNDTQPILNPQPKANPKTVRRFFTVASQFVEHVRQNMDLEHIKLQDGIFDASQETMNCYAKQAKFDKFEPFKV